MRQSTVDMGKYLNEVIGDLKTGLKVDPVIVAHQMVYLALSQQERDAYLRIYLSSPTAIILPNLAAWLGVSVHHAWNITSTLVGYGLVEQRERGQYTCKVLLDSMETVLDRESVA